LTLLIGWQEGHTAVKKFAAAVPESFWWNFSGKPAEPVRTVENLPVKQNEMQVDKLYIETDTATFIEMYKHASWLYFKI